MSRTSCKDTEIQFGRDDQDTTSLEVWTRPDGTVGFLTGHPEGDERYIATLGQAIQLRDFLNRHIDGLALAATGSLAVRSSDDPTQLASEEFIAAVQEGIADAVAGNLVSLNDVKDKWLGRRHPDLVPGKVVDAPAGDLHLVWNPEKTECVGFFDKYQADWASDGELTGSAVSALAMAIREEAARINQSACPILPRTKITFY